MEVELLSPSDVGCAGGKGAVHEVRNFLEAPFDVALRASAIDDGHAARFALLGLGRGNFRRLIIDALAAGER